MTLTQELHNLLEGYAPHYTPPPFLTREGDNLPPEVSTPIQLQADATQRATQVIDLRTAMTAVEAQMALVPSAPAVLSSADYVTGLTGTPTFADCAQLEAYEAYHASPDGDSRALLAPVVAALRQDTDSLSADPLLQQASDPIAAAQCLPEVLEYFTWRLQVLHATITDVGQALGDADTYTLTPVTLAAITGADSPEVLAAWSWEQWRATSDTLAQLDHLLSLAQYALAVPTILSLRGVQQYLTATLTHLVTSRLVNLLSQVYARLIAPLVGQAARWASATPQPVRAAFQATVLDAFVQQATTLRTELLDAMRADEDRYAAFRTHTAHCAKRQALDRWVTLLHDARAALAPIVDASTEHRAHAAVSTLLATLSAARDRAQRDGDGAHV